MIRGAISKFRSWLSLGRGIFIVVILISVVCPYAATIGAQHPDSIPQNCEHVSDNTERNVSNADVIATAHQEGKSGGVVNITYQLDDVNDRYLSIQEPRGSVLLNSSGFDDSGISYSGHIVDSDTDIAWMRYRMSNGSESETSSSDSRFPSSSDFVIAMLPDHTGLSVHIKPEKSGYVGSEILLLGDHRVESQSVGCQEQNMVIPEDVPFYFQTDSRLDDLQVAARTLSNSSLPESVTFYVSPASIGDRGGFAIGGGNEVVINSETEFVTPTTTWMHEYVHTIQRPNQQPDLVWTIEAMAEYLTFKTGVNSGKLTQVQYDYYVSRGVNGDWSGSLSMAAHDEIAYKKGGSTMAMIDADLQAHSNKTIYDLFEWINSHPNPGYDDFRSYLEDDAGIPNSTVESYDEVITGNQTPTVEYKWGHSILPHDVYNALHFLQAQAIQIALLASIAFGMVIGFAVKKLRSFWKGYISFHPDLEF